MRKYEVSRSMVGLNIFFSACSMSFDFKFDAHIGAIGTSTDRYVILRAILPGRYFEYPTCKLVLVP